MPLTTQFDSLIGINGVWHVTNNHPDNPLNATIVLISGYASRSYGYQIVKSSSATLIRHYFGGWSNVWQRLDNFNCNTLSELKEALSNT